MTKRCLDARTAVSWTGRLFGDGRSIIVVVRSANRRLVRGANNDYGAVALWLAAAIWWPAAALASENPGDLHEYPDTLTAELGEEERAALESMAGKFIRPHYRVSSPESVADWKEITASPVPEWLLDAKFGMYTHWGLYSIPAFKGNTYIRYMYTPGGSRGKSSKHGSAYYDYHKKTYGDPTEFGYTDFVPRFTCEKFSGEAYVELMKATGAKFGGLYVVHHDGFLMWDSQVNRWNVGEMGPKRDIYGEFVAAARRSNFKTCATFHHARSWDYAFKDLDLGFYTEAQQKRLDLFDPEKSDYFLGQPGGKLYRDEFAQEWHDKASIYCR